jgi:glycosyltransferase involved in cell wall biosynthesis
MQRKLFRLAVVNSHPVQYFAPLYAYLSGDQDIEITAIYCSDSSLRGGMDPGFGQPVTWNVDLLAGYRSIFLGRRARDRTPRGFFSLVCPEIWRELRTGGYDAVWLHGYAYAAYVLAFVAAKSRGIPVFVRSETHLGLAHRGWRRWLRDGVLRIAYRFVDGFLSIGSANREYYRALGMPEAKIFNVPFTVDNDRFMVAARRAAGRRNEIRRTYGLPLDRLVVLYASKFTRRKHPDDLVAAVARLRDDGVWVTLFLVGTGEMETELRAAVQRRGLDDTIFAGFVNQIELPFLYAASDVFVLPSENEPWGLIVNEVMCAGLPVIVSDEVGCVPDLVQDGINGAHMKAGDVDSLVAALKRVIANDENRRAMGRASLRIIKEWSYEQCRLGVRASLAGLPELQ